MQQSRPLVFPKAKDRPVVISALAAQCEWLLTLDEKDFQGNLGHQIYGMAISTPGKFLLAQRDLGVLRLKPICCHIRPTLHPSGPSVRRYEGIA